MNSIKLFESKQIRSVWNEADNMWYFSIADVVEVLTDSTNVRDYKKKNAQARTGVERQLGDTLSPP